MTAVLHVVKNAIQSFKKKLPLVQSSLFSSSIRNYLLGHTLLIPKKPPVFFLEILLQYFLNILLKEVQRFKEQ